MANTLHRNRLGGMLPTTLGELDHLFSQTFLRPGAGNAPLAVWEAEEKVHIEIEVPGVSIENVDLTYEKGLLSLSVDRKSPEPGRAYWHNERAYGTVSRSVSLPDTVDPDTIEAELVNGVLHVTITKRPELQPKRIEVKVQ